MKLETAMRRALAIGASAMALSWSGGARAQETPAPAASPPADAAGTGDIIVTAQRRSQRLTDVPIAITTQNAAQLAQAGVTNVRDLTLVVPGLLVSGAGTNSQPSIRGIHSDQTDPGNDANVALYVDGVYQANQIANNADLPDVDHIEVLKGPQGTLFGRNATGGAIRIFTREPSFTPTAMIDAGYGSFNDVAVKGYVSGPILGEVVAASLSGGYERADSYLRDGVTGDRRRGLRSINARAKLLVRPSDTLSIALAGSYVDRVDGNATAFQPLAGNTIGRLFGGVFPTAGYRYALNNVPITKVQIYTGSAKIDWTLPGIGAITSLTAYNKVKAFAYNDADFTTAPLLAYPIRERQEDVSQEVIFTSERFGAFQLTAGAFYYNSTGRYQPLALEGSFIGPTLYGYMRQKTEALSGFGEITLTPLARVSIIAGARYSHERRESSGGYFIAPGQPASLPALGSDSFDKLTPRASIRYSLPSGDNLYFTYSKGFKSGGFNLAALSTTAYKPETVDAFEIGVKTSTRRAISANISAFYYSYKDQQVSAAVNGLNVTANAASSRIYGVDADVTIRPSPDFTTTIGLSYLHARFRDYAGAVFNVPTRIGGVVCACGNDTAVGDLSGGIEPYSPDFTIGITPAYHRTFDAGTLDLSAALYSSSGFYFDNNARVRQPAYATVAARASFRPAGLPFSVYVWGRNLTGTRYFGTVFINNAGDGFTYAAPRNAGIGARLEF